jgi:hypothetical protein
MRGQNWSEFWREPVDWWRKVRKLRMQGFEAMEEVVPAAPTRALEVVEIEPGYLDALHASRYLGIAESGLRAMVKRGHGPGALQFGEKLLRFDRLELDRWARSKKVAK